MIYFFLVYIFFSFGWGGEKHRSLSMITLKMSTLRQKKKRDKNRQKSIKALHRILKFPFLFKSITIKDHDIIRYRASHLKILIDIIAEIRILHSISTPRTVNKSLIKFIYANFL